MRNSEISRRTKETEICVKLSLDEKSGLDIDTGIGFFDHMLTAFAFHAGIGLELKAKGDLLVDLHHVVEDTAIVLGKALAEALGKGGPVVRYACAYIPMDEALACTVIDISGRPYLKYVDGGLSQKSMPGFDTALIPEFLRAFAFNAGITLHVKIEYGDNAHHMAEALFKSLGYALKGAVRPADDVLSTKGMLD
jgi:imidazoleglycerol-phosphate dehydratase